MQMAHCQTAGTDTSVGTLKPSLKILQAKSLGPFRLKRQIRNTFEKKNNNTKRQDHKMQGLVATINDYTQHMY